MEVVVIIPSLNEEGSISGIVKVVDGGLSKYYPNSDSLILNVDSSSQDKTVEVFINTSTIFPKKSIVNKSLPKGKGSNIRKAILHSKNADYFLMLDADLVSAKENWLKKFINPLINNSASMVAPIYTRNRYEGNTTNHFSSPIIYACLGRDIVQPIAGDFAFNRSLALDILKNIVSPSDQMYGIDTIITWTAILKEHEISQIKLWRKIHKPSFPKIVPMFEQVAATTFRLVNQNRHKIAKNVSAKIRNPERHNVIDKKFIQIPDKNRVHAIEELATCRLRQYKPPDFINKKLYKKGPIKSKEWVEILSGYLYYLLKKKLDIKQIEFLSRSIVSLYLFRVLGYFIETNKATPRETEDILYKQKLFLRKCLMSKFWG